MPAKIETRTIFKTFETPTGPVQALGEVDLAAQPGEFVALGGESGCGKTTLLRIVAGLVAPTQGEVWIEGERVTGPSQHVGVVFQRPVLLPWRTAVENVLLPAHVRRLSLADAAAEARGLL